MNNQTLPPFASALAGGDYLAINAILPTRDGRSIGNSTVLSIIEEPSLSGRMVANVVSESGRECRFTVSELEALFYPPEYIRKPVGVVGELIESTAQAMAVGIAGMDVADNASSIAQMSSAISLKRIADAIEGSPSKLGFAEYFGNVLSDSIFNLKR